MMKAATRFFPAFLILLLSGCSNSGNDSGSGKPNLMYPDYATINTPSEDPATPWYIGDYFQRIKGWRLETDVALSDLELGMYELTQYPDQEPTQVQSYAASKLVSDAMDAAVRNGWLSKEKGLSDGYEGMFKDAVHFVKKEYVFDGETLNPEKPEVLMYYKTDAGDFLMGVMFIAVGQRGPQVAGPLTRWHFHIDRRVCYEVGVLPIGQRDDRGNCRSGVPNSRSPEMMHVWFFDHPEGRFATGMGLTPEQLKNGVEQILAAQEEQRQ